MVGGESGPPQGQQAYTTPGTYSWVAPAGVTSVCVVCVGGGAVRYAGALGWKNNISVTPGNSYTVVVGAGSATSFGAGGTSYFISTSEIGAQGGGGISGPQADFIGSGVIGVNTGGGKGGGENWFGGGGAGGYSGNGGAPTFGNGGSGSGGAGGAGASLSGSFGWFGGGGGGVGILGQGANGNGGSVSGSLALGGGGGSAGGNGGIGSGYSTNGGGGAYGGAGGFGYFDDGVDYYESYGARSGGAVRIIWGVGRSFPSTNTGDV